MTDPGFDASVLSEFRARLVAGDAALSLLDALLARCRAAGLLKARGRQRTDSTHVLAAVRVLNRLTGVGETLRHALNVLATVAPDWLRPHLARGWDTWAERYGARFDLSRLPKDPAAREALAVAIGADGSRLLGAVYAPDAPEWLRAVPAVETLRRVWLQQYHPPDAPGSTALPRWRASTDLPPAAQMIHSPHDVDARFSLKRETKWTGYKVHLTEVCDPDAPHLITHVDTTPATTQDVERLAPIHAALAAKDLLPREHLVDTGYVDAEGLVRSETDYGVRVIGPALPDNSWPARTGQGFDVAHFAVDWAQRRATCPQGQTSVKWSPTHNTQGHAIINIRFPRAACLACPSRAACPSSVAGPRGATRDHGPAPRPARGAPNAAPRPDHAGLQGAVPGPRGGRGDAGAGPPRQRPAPRPLHRPRQDPPAARPHRHGAQRAAPGCLVGRTALRRHPLRRLPRAGPGRVSRGPSQFASSVEVLLTPGRGKNAGD